MRGVIVSVAILLVFLAGTARGEVVPKEQRIQNVENGLVEFSPGPPDTTQAPQKAKLLERMSFYKVPSVSVAVIDGNKIEWAKAYGVLKAGSESRATTESLFEAASTTKLLVAAIVLRLVEQGGLDLDEDVNNALKSWKIPENEFTKKHKVTLRLLLTHQAGLNRPDGGFEYEGAPTLLQTLKGEAPVANDAAAVEYIPGSKWQYSNFGYLVIQLLLEDLLGKPFTRIAQETIFEPLGMTSSTLVVPLSDEEKAKEALPHDAEGTAHEPQLHPNAVANGGLMTTPTDLALFTIELIRAYKGESDRLLSQKMARQMLHKELDLDPSLLGMPLGEGLGVLLHGEGRNLSFLHPGDNFPGASCWLVGCPETGKGAVIMTNGAMGNLLAMEIVAAVADEYEWPAVR